MIIMSPHCARSQSEFKLWTGCAVFTYTQHSECPSLVNFMFMWHPMNKEMAKLRHKCVVLDTSSSFLFGEKLFPVFWLFMTKNCRHEKYFNLNVLMQQKPNIHEGIQEAEARPAWPGVGSIWGSDCSGPRYMGTSPHNIASLAPSSISRAWPYYMLHLFPEIKLWPLFRGMVTEDGNVTLKGQVFLMKLSLQCLVAAKTVNIHRTWSPTSPEPIHHHHGWPGQGMWGTSCRFKSYRDTRVGKELARKTHRLGKAD